MAQEDRKRWDEKHAESPGEDSPSPFLAEIFSSGSWSLEPGKALDIATGKGRNAFFLAERGFHVDAMDISEAALKDAIIGAQSKGLAISFIGADLDHVELPVDAYELITNFNFLQRTLIPKMKKALKLGGHIVFETYLIDQRVLGHPRNPDYLLGHNELLDLFRDFRILFYREGKIIESGKEAFRARLLAQKIK
jgi:SAM-dependent methyltransferase